MRLIFKPLLSLAPYFLGRLYLYIFSRVHHFTLFIWTIKLFHHLKYYCIHPIITTASAHYYGHEAILPWHNLFNNNFGDST
jgi:hypothetical protein